MDDGLMEAKNDSSFGTTVFVRYGAVVGGLLRAYARVMSEDIGGIMQGALSQTLGGWLH